MKVNKKNKLLDIFRKKSVKITLFACLGFLIILLTLIFGIILTNLYRDYKQGKDLNKSDKKECLYNSGIYAEGIFFDAVDKCNICFCYEGDVTCTAKNCSENVENDNDNSSTNNNIDVIFQKHEEEGVTLSVNLLKEGEHIGTLDFEVIYGRGVLIGSPVLISKANNIYFYFEILATGCSDMESPACLEYLETVGNDYYEVGGIWKYDKDTQVFSQVYKIDLLRGENLSMPVVLSVETRFPGSEYFTIKYSQQKFLGENIVEGEVITNVVLDINTGNVSVE